MPFWTVILLAGRMAIPPEIYDAAKVDGATGLRRFVHVSFPLLANLYLVCTLLSTIFTLGDFNTVTFVTGGGPANSTHVLATLGIRDAFDTRQPAARRRRGDVGVAADDPAGHHPDAQAARPRRCSYEPINCAGRAGGCERASPRSGCAAPRGAATT